MADGSRATVAVIGAGTMGAGIAQVALEAGWLVALHDAREGAVDRARDRIEEGLRRRAARDALREPLERTLGRLHEAATTAEAVHAAHLAIEAVVEDLHVKQSLFVDLDLDAPPDAILATNTSALSVARIAERVRRPERVLGLHFFNPAPVLPLVEVVRAPRTAPDVLERAVGIVDAWGKAPITVADAPGFIVNRVNRPYTLEPLRLLHAGVATVEAIDRALVTAGFPMGPFALMDLIGIDVNLAATRGLFEAFGKPARLRPSPLQEELVAAGQLGRKTGQGFHRYAEGRPAGPAPRFAARPGRAAPALDDATIAERVILAVVNEAFRALGDGVASRDDIDRAMRLGASYPFGPLAWATRTGVAEVAAMLDALSDEDADTFRPALALLREARS